MEALFAALRAHPIIAWDFDQTLFGHSASPVLHDFIAAHRQLRHVIVTFRSQTSEARLWADLASATSVIGRDHFSAVAMMEDDLAQSAQRLRRNRRQGLYAGPFSPAERAWRLWKGQACRDLSAGVLVDDQHEDVADGCALHGIVLLHPDQFAVTE